MCHFVLFVRPPFRSFDLFVSSCCFKNCFKKSWFFVLSTLIYVLQRWTVSTKKAASWCKAAECLLTCQAWCCAITVKDGTVIFFIYFFLHRSDASVAWKSLFGRFSPPSLWLIFFLLWVTPSNLPQTAIWKVWTLILIKYSWISSSTNYALCFISASMT